MDIEHLSKVQIVLLTLLVSFVTSIATGIVTVSLMQQAPPAIAQTVNRIIEHTVQTVIPAGQTSASVITQEKTVVVKETDLISQAVDRASPSVTRIFTADAESPTFLGLGVVLDASGTVAVDTDSLGDGADAVVVLPDGTRVRSFVRSRDLSDGVAFLAPATTTTAHWQPASISLDHAALGESVVVLAGNTLARIQDGIVTSITPAPDGTPQIIDTSISGSFMMDGSPLIGTDGSFIGFSTVVSRAASPSGFVPAAVLLKGDVPPTKSESKAK